MPNTDLPESEFLRHEPCPNCGSKDNLARYSDGHAYCFGCQHYEHADTDKEIPVTDTVEKSEPLADVTYRELKTRGLSEETCRLFDYGWNGKRQVATYRDATGKTLAQKFKTADKQFYLQGSGRALPLWGMHLWSSGGKMVVVTGCNSGVGLETAAQLLALGATVVFACRSESRARAAMPSCTSCLGTASRSSQCVFCSARLSSVM